MTLAVRLSRMSAFVVLCCVATSAGRCQPPQSLQKVHIKPSSSLQQVSRSEYLAQLTHLQTLVEQCRTDPGRCDPKAVPDDEPIDSGRFTIRWQWLRHVLEPGADPKAKDRLDSLDAAAKRLQDDAAEAAGSGDPQELNAVPEGRRQADAILHRPEFRRVRQSSWFQRWVAAGFLFLTKLFSGAGKYLPRLPWLPEAIEWGLLMLAAAGLLLWLGRQHRRQRLVIAADHHNAATLWQKESDNWAERARAEAGRGDWREAVHCLYWSAIVMLEGQKLWRQNRARTPREYLVLLEPGSPRRNHLNGLTRVFERIWYGLRPATQVDYQQAEALLDRLRVG